MPRRASGRHSRPPGRLGTIPAFPETSATRMTDIECDIRATIESGTTASLAAPPRPLRHAARYRSPVTRGVGVSSKAPSARFSHLISIIRVADASGKAGIVPSRPDAAIWLSSHRGVDPYQVPRAP